MAKNSHDLVLNICDGRLCFSSWFFSSFLCFGALYRTILSLWLLLLFFYYYYSLNIVQQSNHIIHALSICGQWTLYYNLHALVAHILCAACKRKCLRHGVCVLCALYRFVHVPFVSLTKTKYQNHKIKCSTQLLIVHFWTVKREEKKTQAFWLVRLDCAAVAATAIATPTSTATAAAALQCREIQDMKTPAMTPVSRHRVMQKHSQIDLTAQWTRMFSTILLLLSKWKKNIKNWVSRQQCTLRRANDHKPASQPAKWASHGRQAGKQETKQYR